MQASKPVTISQPVLLANNQPGPTVFRDDNSNTEITWEGAGDPQGQDIQPIPVFFLENTNFLRILNKGIFRLVSAPPEVCDLLEAYLSDPTLTQQRASWLASQSEHAGPIVEQPLRPDIVFSVDPIPGYNEAESTRR
jgi:hypothetical protein